MQTHQETKYLEPQLRFVGDNTMQLRNLIVQRVRRNL